MVKSATTGRPVPKPVTRVTAKEARAGLLAERRKDQRAVAKYDPDMALKVCEAIAEGFTLSEVCKTEGYPVRQTFHRWVAQYPEVKKAYDAARELSANSFEEEALDMARILKEQKTFTGTRIRAFEVAMNQLRWSAARRDPARYGNQGDKTMAVIPIQINTTLDMGAGGYAGLSTPEHPNVYRVEGGATIEVPSEPKSDIMPEKNKGGRPKKGHKSPAQIRATKMAHARVKKQDG